MNLFEFFFIVYFEQHYIKSVCVIFFLFCVFPYLVPITKTVEQKKHQIQKVFAK